MYALLITLIRILISTPGGSGHVTMQEQPCTVTVDGVKYENVMVRGRGHTFAAYPDKQPMRLRFPRKTPLLGKRAKKWTILTMNDDPTLMRDALSWHIARFVGMDYVPAHTYAEVIVDGRNQGICLLADHVEAGEGRVELGKGRDAFFAELDGYADGRFFRTPRLRNTVRLHYPDGYGDDFDEAAMRVIDFENALGSERWHAMVDTASLVAWFITSELTGNPDTYWSLYFYKPAGDDRLHFGPIWDNGKAFGNDSRLQNTVKRHTHEFAFSASQNWGSLMWQDEWFRKLVRDRWDALDKEALIESVDSLITSLEPVLRTDGSSLRAFVRERVFCASGAFSVLCGLSPRVRFYAPKARVRASVYFRDARRAAHKTRSRANA